MKFTSPTYLNNTVISSFIIPFNLSFSPIIKPNRVNVTLYNRSSFLNSSLLEDTSNLEFFSGNFTSFNDGFYYLNGSVDYERNVKGLIETRTIILDNTPPIFFNQPVYNFEEGVNIDLVIPFYDLSPILSWEINDTEHFNISSSGRLNNKTFFSEGEIYSLKITAIDILGNSNSTSLTLNITRASNSSIGLDLLFPITNFSISQNKTFIVGVNVSCHKEDCGEIQVSLDPNFLNNYTFTTCNQIGRFGPNQSQCDNAYNNTPLQNKVKVYQGYQYFNITSSGEYLVEAYGARGGSQPEYNYGGKGAKISGIFYFNRGDKLILVIGQNGQNSTQADGDGGGGGGTFLAIINESSPYVLFDGNHVTPLIIAGGGGADSSDGTGAGGSANTTSTGYFPNNGYGVGGNHPSGGSGGGGFITDGKNFTLNLGGGKSFLNGALGGLNSSGNGASIGGFGGGAGANDEMGAGGGGWNGGVGYDNCLFASGGGGSYNIGNNQSNIENISNFGLLNLFQLSSTSKEGLISTDNSSTPFYSLNENPILINLSLGESKIVSWRIKTTGDKGDSDFFIYANKTSRMFISNTTPKWSVNIKNIQDNLPPLIKIIFPFNNSFSNNSRLTINYSVSDPNLQTCWYSNDSFEINNTLFNCENLTSIIWSEGQHKVIIWSEDINNNENYSFISFNIDTTNPLISFSPQNPENMSLINDNFTIYAYLNEPNLANITLNWDGTLIAFNNSSKNLIHLENNNFIFVYNQTKILPNQIYFYQINVSDLAGNKNSTEIRFVKGDSAPSYISISQTPNIFDYDNLDPNQKIIIIANISDIDQNFDSAILQWKNSTNTFWENITMINLTEKGYYTLVQTEFLTPPYEDNITYRVWVNDTTGKFSLSNNFTMPLFWDCSWLANFNTNQTVGWSENREGAILTINNTGDLEYSNQNCTLLFHLSHDLSSGRIYFNNWENNKWQNYYDTPPILAKSSLIIPINITFLSEIKEEIAKISILELTEKSNLHIANNSLFILSNKEGPYLYQQISDFPLQPIYLTYNNSFRLQAYLRNLMGNGLSNNSAYNVSFYWVLPPDLKILSGDSSKELINLSDNLPRYLNSEVGLSDLSLATPGVKSIFLYSLGFDNFGNLIYDSNNRTILLNSLNLTFLCYNISDGVYVPSCGSLDGDYIPPLIPQSTNFIGGGGSAEKNTLLEKKADFQFVRGKNDEIKITFKNDFNSSLKDINFSLTGNLSKYIQIFPYKLNKLEPFEEIELSLKITSPGFIPLGKQILFLNIIGKRDNTIYTEKRTIILQVNDLSNEEAEALLNRTDFLFQKMKEENISLSDDLITSLNRTIYESYENLDFNLLQESFNNLENLVNSALTSKNIINELTILIKESEEKQIDVSKTKRLLKLAELSFSRKEFSESLARLKEAQITFSLETKGASPSIFYYLKYKTKEVMLSLIFLSFFIFLIFKFIQNSILINKIKNLKNEEKIIQSLIKDSQKRIFVEKKISVEEYSQSMEYLERRLSEIVQGIINLEKQKENLFKFKFKEKSLFSEKKMIIDKLKEIQTDYLKKKNIDKKTYDIMIESYNKRLSQIEELIANIEAKKDFKKEMKLNIKKLRGRNHE